MSKPYADAWVSPSSGWRSGQSPSPTNALHLAALIGSHVVASPGSTRQELVTFQALSLRAASSLGPSQRSAIAAGWGRSLLACASMEPSGSTRLGRALATDPATRLMMFGIPGAVAGGLTGALVGSWCSRVAAQRWCTTRMSRQPYRGRAWEQRLLRHVEGLTDKPILIGTWASASWAIEFYQRNGFTLVPNRDKDRLLRTYWSIPARQIETSVVLADGRWREAQERPSTDG
jgi:GNAT superfamily N-acetyltransferase